jgi:diguanylate cyclase (GGDEF)-like protein
VLDANMATLKLYNARNIADLQSNFGKIFMATDADAIREQVVQIHHRTRRFEQILENSTVKGKKITVYLQWTTYPGQAAHMDRVVVSTLDVTEQNKANKLQAAILRISQAAMTSNLISELFEIIHETLQTLMPARNMYIALYDAKTEIISFPYFADEMDEPPPSRKFGHGWTEIVINSGKPVLIHEDLMDGLESPDQKVQGTRPVGWLGAPLFVQDKIIGVLVVQSYDPATIYTNEDKDLLMIAANQVAMAIYKKKTEERLIFSTSHDELTGLYNRAFFEDEVKRLSELPDEPIGVIMMDLDNLKYTNDTYGHAAGDQLIRTTSSIIRTAFRMKDMIARIGGDEIVVLIPGASREILQTAIDRVRMNLAQYNRVLTDKDSMISLSLGGSITSAEVTLEQAIQAADEEMYREKADKKAHGAEYMRK